jgi:hypothetical protein
MRSLAHSFAVIVRELLDGATADEAWQASGIARRVVVKLCQEMHLIGLVHVTMWNRRPMGGEPVPVYKIGRGSDAPKPPPFGNAEAAKKWRAGQRGRNIQSAANLIAKASEFR